MQQVVEIRRIEQARPYAADWSRLLRCTPGATFFHTLDWLEVYWRHFGREQQLRLLVVLEENRPIGFVPFVIRLEDKRIAQLQILTFPLHDWGSFYGPIGRDPQHLLQVALRHLRATPRDWDMIDLRWLGGYQNEEATPATGEILERTGFPARRRLWKQVAIIDTTGSWDEYLQSRSSKLRSSIRRYERRLARLGNVELQRYRPTGTRAGDDDPHWDDFETCVELSHRSWQGASTDGTTLSHDTVAEYLRDTHRVAICSGMADMNILRLDGQPIAFAYNYVLDGAVYGLRIGYDPRYSKDGAGKVLWARTFEDSFRRGDRVYDIGPDSLEVKIPWLTRVVPVFAYAHYPRFAARSQLVRLASWARQYQRSPSPRVHDKSAEPGHV
ncbi:MAG: GNAT family N-acetyltransferase [Pirellulales bacterium]